jgi:hypothetical protein
MCIQTVGIVSATYIHASTNFASADLPGDACNSAINTQNNEQVMAGANMAEIISYTV